MKRREEEKLKNRKERIKNKFLYTASSYMSNAKWRKFIGAIDKIESILIGSNWKLVWDKNIIHENSVPNSRDIERFHLVDGIFYFVVYDEIEWVELLTNQPNVVIAHFSAIAQFELEETISGVKVYGYRSHA